MNTDTPKAFRPTYIYIKQHKVTGMLYLGKTFHKNVVTYTGSGKIWKRHIAVHGKQIETLWYCLFTDSIEMTKFALMISEQYDIVKSKEWANLKPEDGLTGNRAGWFVAVDENGNRFTTNDKSKTAYNVNANVSKEEYHRRRLLADETRKINGTWYKSGEAHHNFGRTVEIELGLQIGETLKSRYALGEIKAWNDGLKISEIESESERKKYGRNTLGNKNPAFGRTWLNNGITAVFPIKDSEEYLNLIQLGYVKGNLKK